MSLYSIGSAISGLFSPKKRSSRTLKLEDPELSDRESKILMPRLGNKVLSATSEPNPYVSSLNPNIYVPIGHGEEDVTGEKPVIPAGCQLVVLAECKRPVVWKNTQNNEHFNIKKFIAANPKDISIFADPVHNKRKINTAIGSICAFYTAGDEYPDIAYDLNLQWFDRGKFYVRYSGVVPFTTYVSNEEDTGFTTKEVGKEIYPRGIYDLLDPSKKRELYRYSVYPRPEEFPTQESTEAEMIEFLLHTHTNEGVSPTRESLETRSKEELYTLILDMNSYDRVERVRLSTLMAQLPGVYYHLVCRGNDLSDPRLQGRRRKSFIQRRLPEVSKNDLFEYIRKPYTISNTGIKPQFFYENARNSLGPYENLPPNIREAFNTSRKLLLRSEGAAQGGRRRTHKQQRKKKTV